jgi:hypothetical protein
MLSIYSFNFEVKPVTLLYNANVSKIAQTDKCSGHVDTHTSTKYNIKYNKNVITSTCNKAVGLIYRLHLHYRKCGMKSLRENIL